MLVREARDGAGLRAYRVGVRLTESAVANPRLQRCSPLDEHRREAGSPPPGRPRGELLLRLVRRRRDPGDLGVAVAPNFLQVRGIGRGVGHQFLLGHEWCLLSTLVREAGYDRVSDKLLEDLEFRLEEKGVRTHPKLTDPSNTGKTRIHFFDLKRLVPGLQQPQQLFAEEKELSRFLQMNWDHLAYVKKHSLRLRGCEIRIAENCTVDLLAVDKKQDVLVAFELKVSEGDDRLVGQAAKYVAALQKQADKEGRAGARLVIVTGQPDEELAARVQDLAEKYGVAVEWLLYSVSIDLSAAR